MKSFLRRLALWSWYGVAALVVVVALLVSLGQYYFPLLSDYRNELLKETRESLPFRLEIDDMRAEWVGLAPTIYLEGVRLYALDPSDALIAVARSTEVRLDIPRSIRAGAPRLRRVLMRGAELELVEDSAGSWRVVGDPIRGGTGGDPQPLLDFLLGIGEVELTDSRLSIRTENGQRLGGQSAGLLLENYSQFRRLTLNTRDETGATFGLIGESVGDPVQNGDFEAKLWLDLNEIDLSKLRQIAALAQLPQGRVSGQLWFTRERTGAFSMTGDLRSEALQLAGNTPQTLSNLEMRLAADFDSSNMTLWLRDVGADWHAERIMADTMRVDVRRDEQTYWTRLASNYIDLAPLATALRSSGALPPPAEEILSDLDPYGGLANLLLSLRHDPATGLDFRLRTRLEDVSVSPWSKAPGVRNAAGYLEMTAREGFADLDTGSLTLEFPGLFDDDLNFDQARGRVSWNVDPEGIYVGSELLRLRDGDTTFAAGFDVRLQAAEADDDEFTLRVGAADGTAALRKSLVPAIVSKDLRDWLDTSISRASVRSGVFFLHQRLGQPDNRRTTMLQLGLDVVDGVLMPAPSWPMISGIDALVWLNGAETYAKASSARIYNSRIQSANVRVTPTQDQTLRLAIAGTAAGDSEDGLKILQETPIADRLGPVLGDWQSSGAMRVDLDLDLRVGQSPSATAGDRIAVQVALDDASLSLPALDLKFARVFADLGWHLDNGLRADAISAMLWNRPLRGAISSDNQSALSLVLEGSARVADIARWAGVGLADYLTGEAPVTFRLDTGQREGYRLRIDSPLRGVESALPYPLAKDARSDLPLRLQLTPGHDLEASLGEVLNVAFSVDSDGRYSGDVALGEARAVPGGDEVRLTGRIDRANAGEWIDTIIRLLDANPGGANADRRFRVDDLDIAELALVNTAVMDVRLDSAWSEQAFELGFSADLLRGRLRMPSPEHPHMRLDIDELQGAAFWDLTPGDDNDNAESVATDEQPIDNDDTRYGWERLQKVRIAPIDVRIAKLLNGDNALGEWTFMLEANSEQLLISKLEARLPGLQVTGIDGRDGARLSLGWENNQPRTGLSASLRMNNALDAMQLLGMDATLESRKGLVDLALSWPGVPPDIAAGALDGRISVGFDDGRLLQVDGNNPIMRTLGALNFNEIFRRLQFDFKDFYEKGLAYERIKAVIALDAGQATTADPIEPRGPSARIRLDGSSDLKERTVEGELVVTLPIGSNLPWIAVLAGGLPAAAGALVASKLFEEQLGKFSSAVYAVTGTLDEPELTFQRVFDAVPDTGKRDAEADPISDVATKDGVTAETPGDQDSVSEPSSSAR